MLSSKSCVGVDHSAEETSDKCEVEVGALVDRADHGVKSKQGVVGSEVPILISSAFLVPRNCLPRDRALFSGGAVFGLLGACSITVASSSSLQRLLPEFPVVMASVSQEKSPV